MRQSHLQGESASIGFTVKTGIELLLWPLIVPVLAGAGASSLHAQGGSPTYPYCAQYSDGTSLDCSFSTLSMCYQSVTGLGGVCIDNPRASSTRRFGRAEHEVSVGDEFGLRQWPGIAHSYGPEKSPLTVVVKTQHPN